MACERHNFCSLRKPEKRNKISGKWKKECRESKSNWKNCVRYQKEEKNESYLNNIMPDGTIKKLN